MKKHLETEINVLAKQLSRKSEESTSPRVSMSFQIHVNNSSANAPQHSVVIKYYVQDKHISNGERRSGFHMQLLKLLHQNKHHPSVSELCTRLFCLLFFLMVTNML